jgi:hypothetical protein
MFGDAVNSTKGYACDTQHKNGRFAATQLHRPPGRFVTSTPRVPADDKNVEPASAQEVDTQSHKIPLAPPPGAFIQSLAATDEDSVLEQDPDPQSNKKVLVPPPGAFIRPRAAMDEDSVPEQQVDLSSYKASLAPPPGDFIRPRAALDKEQEAEPQSSKAPLAPPPGAFIRPRGAVDEDAVCECDKNPQPSKAFPGPPPGVFRQSSATLPLLLGRSHHGRSFNPNSSPAKNQQPYASQQHREHKPTLGSPPGFFVTDAECEKHITTGLAKPAQNCETSRGTMKLPPDFRPPPGLEPFINPNLDWYSEVTDATKRKLSKNPFGDSSDSLDLSTVAGSTFRSSDDPTDEVEQISSQDELDHAERVRFQTDLPAFGGAELRLDDLVDAQRNVGDSETLKKKVDVAAWTAGMQMMPLPFVSSATVRMAWQQVYGCGEPLARSRVHTCG